MSDAFLPSFRGLSWSLRRSVLWATRLAESVGGREYRSSRWAYPRYEWQLDYSLLRQTASAQEVDTLIGFINARRGSFDSFLYLDDSDKTATNQQFGTGTGTQTAFRLVRARGGFAEPVRGLSGVPVITNNGVTVSTGYTVSPDAVVTFGTAPANGAVLRWTGTFAWRVRFTRDQTDIVEEMKSMNSLRGLGMRTLKTGDLLGS